MTHCDLSPEVLRSHMIQMFTSGSGLRVVATPTGGPCLLPPAAPPPLSPDPSDWVLGLSLVWTHLDQLGSSVTSWILQSDERDLSPSCLWTRTRPCEEIRQ